MFRIDVPSAAPALPVPAAAGTGGFFTDGDAVAGQPGTIVTADFLNMVMMELMNIVIAAGITPSKSVNTQVRDAIAVLGDVATNGSLAIPVGTQKLIINWGVSSTTDGTGLKDVDFVRPFETAVFATFATNRGAGLPTAFHGTGNISNTKMTVNSAQSSGVAAGSGTAFAWLAIGF